MTERVLARCRGLGFAEAGVCSAAPTEFRGELVAWLDEGKQGSMEWLAERVETRCDPGRVLEGARSVVMVADLYATRGDNADPPLPDGYGRIARYARGRDYHDVIKKRLHTLCDELRAEFLEAGFRAFVDTAPVLERELAMRAGLGWTGKHTLTIHPKLGSCMLLGGVLTTLDLPTAHEPMTDHCGTCTRCINSCPTDAITPYSVDARRCISYLTIEHRGPIDPEFFGGIGSWVFGCDVCQEACPHNSPRETDAEINPAYAATRDSFDLLEVLGWTEDDRRAALKGSAMKRAKLEMWKRNAAVCLANQGRLPDKVEADSELVRETLAALREQARGEPAGDDDREADGEPS
ncbi:MAG: tRNA epoxyqueuosine(34) reductase QueG [Planctomycetota bacterium]